ncbi:MAG: LptE family protein [Bacteroidaceae bacterium]|nr:LptE family protein [Bacteroidaceae bacterium]
MIWNKPTGKPILALLVLVGALTLVACQVSYKFTSTSINYDVTKTIQIEQIANRAPYGWAPMQAIFNNTLQDLYANQTKLTFVKKGGDLTIAGEITGYEQYNKAVAADGYAAQVQLKMTVNIRYENKHKNQSWERQFSATTQYDANQQLTAVQEELVTQMCKDIADQIFNATVADW